MKSETILEKIRAIFKTELEEVKTADGATLYADMFEVGEAVFVVNEEERVALPVGEYELEDGTILVVTEEGIIGELRTAEQPVEESEDEPKEELSAESISAMIKKAIDIDAIAEAVKSKLNVDSKIEEMKSQLSKQMEDLIENQPAEEAPRFSPEGKPSKNLNTTERVYSRLYKNY